MVCALLSDVDKLQRSFIRYGASSLPATEAPIWQKTLSVSAGQNSRYGVAGSNNGSADGVAQLPDSISMQVTRAPAEFAVPVKQDRCVSQTLLRGSVPDELRSLCTLQRCWRSGSRPNVVYIPPIQIGGASLRGVASSPHGVCVASVSSTQLVRNLERFFTSVRCFVRLW